MRFEQSKSNCDHLRQEFRLESFLITCHAEQQRICKKTRERAPDHTCAFQALTRSQGVLIKPILPIFAAQIKAPIYHLLNVIDK